MGGEKASSPTLKEGMPSARGLGGECDKMSKCPRETSPFLQAMGEPSPKTAEDEKREKEVGRETRWE